MVAAAKEFCSFSEEKEPKRLLLLRGFDEKDQS
jgi:hypothetical protein